MTNKASPVKRGYRSPLREQQALSLYNDMVFRDKATAAATKLGKITDKESKEFRDLQAQMDAYIANINADVLKPKAG